MEPIVDNTWERSLEQLARRLEYPPTPDIAATAALTARPQQAKGGGRRGAGGGRLVWALAIIAMAIAVMLAVPQTRAAVLSLFARIGAIDIFIDETAPTPPPTVGATAAPTATDPDRADHSMALFDMGQMVTLDEARRTADFPIVVPGALGEPDEVYTHRNVDLPAVTLVWRDGAGAALSLTEIGIGEFAMKMVGEEGAKSLQVGELAAVWIEGPHMLQLFGYWEANSLLIESNVLIWAAGDVTYRLEGKLTQDEARAIAEAIESDQSTQ